MLKINPPNVPQLRPIERYWAILSKMIYTKWPTTDTVPLFIRRVRSLVKKSPESFAQNLMRGIKTKVRKAADRTPLSVHN
jgi:hypothetical protein